MNTKNKLLLIFLGFIIIPSVDASFCTNTYYPVCWLDGITYQNACILKESWIELDHFWSCESDEVPEQDLTEDSSVNETYSKIELFLDNYFSKK